MLPTPLPRLLILLWLAALWAGAANGASLSDTAPPHRYPGVKPNTSPPINYPDRPQRHRRPCPRGTIGLYPFCHRLPTIQPRCPRGSRGRWPDCHQVPRRSIVPPPSPPRRQAPASPPAPVVPSPIVATEERWQRADELVVSLPLTTATTNARTLARRYRLLLLGSEQNRLLQRSMAHFRIPDRRSLQGLMAQLQREPMVLAVQSNRLYRRSGHGGERDLATQQYAVDKLQLLPAHQLAQGRSCSIAVIDAAIDSQHPELAGSITQQFDAVGATAPAMADRHGTALAGIIAAHQRLLGVAPAASLLAIRAFFSEKGESLTTSFILLRALEWAVGQQARVVNLSLSGPADPLIEAALQAAAAQGVTLVAAAGNGGAEAQPAYPAAYPQVIAVTALDAYDQRHRQSQQGDYISLAAPGVDILAPTPAGGYGFHSGSSFAAAQVSGVVALLLEREPLLTPAAIRTRLMESAIDLGPPGRDRHFGAGRVDALRVLQAN